MRSAALDVCLRDGTHTKLVISTGEESGEGADKRNGAFAATAADTDADQVLLGNEALDEALGEGFSGR